MLQAIRQEIPKIILNNRLLKSSLVAHKDILQKAIQVQF